MKKTIIIIALAIFCASFCEAQNPKRQLKLADLITLTTSNSSESLKTFMSAKGWRKLPFEILRDEDNTANNYSGRLPLGFKTDDTYQYADRTPNDYKKFIWGSNDGNPDEYLTGEHYCYVYWSPAEKSAVAFSDGGSTDRLLAEFFAAGFKKTSETLWTAVYRNDTYELEIYKGIHYFFYNYKAFEEQKLKRKAEADKQNAEQWQKIQKKISSETLADLLPEAYELGKQGVYPRESLLDLDVLEYFSKEIPRDKIDSELKISIFKKSEEYNEKLESLKKLRQQVFSSVYYIRDDAGYNTFSSSLYAKAVELLSNSKYKYSMADHGFKIHLLDWNDRSEIKSKVICISSFDAVKSRFLIVNTLPVRKDDNGEYFLVSMDETTALEIENNRKDMQTYLFFRLNGKYDNKSKALGEQLLYTDKVRIVLANKRSGKIYYDQSFPEDCLPLAKQETMTSQEYSAYKAEQERKLAEERERIARREEEKIQEARRKEQERIETEKRKIQEKYNAAIARLGTSFTFDSESDYPDGKLQWKSGSKFHGKPVFVDDTPGGKGKSVLMDSKTSLYIKEWNTHTVKIPVTLSVWIKIPDNNNNNPQYFGNEYYWSQLANKIIPVCNDNQWHWLCIISDLKNASVGDANGYSMIDGGTCAFYVDGKLIKNILLPKRRVNKGHNSDMDFSIGNRNGSMIIDHLRLGNNMLSDEDIAIIYEKEKNQGSIAKPSANSSAGDTEDLTIKETQPEFPGGISGLSAYLGQNLKYPPVASEEGIQGKVVVRFVVGKDGSISDVQVTKSVHPDLDKEALRVVRSMPKWKPATQFGKPVSVQYTMPIGFKL